MAFPHKLWFAHRDMLRRCYDPRASRYPRYGGRGIEVCQPWHDFQTFKAWAFEAGVGPGLSIDRIDNDGHYEPANCRWATNQQQYESRSTTHKVIYRGEILTLRECERRAGIPRANLWDRIFREGWPVDRALETPIAHKMKGQIA